MKIYSWNVNGLRAAVRKGFLEWLTQTDADLVGLQEVRATPDQLKAKTLSPEGWSTHFFPAERKGYSGVGLYTRRELDTVETTLGVPEFDAEGRVQIARLGRLTVVNVYFPNGSGKNRDLSRIPYKLDFYEHLRERFLPALKAREPLLVMGDFNTAHRPIDLARPKQNEKTSGFRPEERAILDKWFDDGWVDTFRHYCDEPEHYTWWSQRKGVRERNIGWRIDFILASPGAMEFVTGAAIHPEVMGSDHCPISVTLRDEVVG